MEFFFAPKNEIDLLTHLHMSDYKPSPTPFQSSVKLTVECTTPLVYATLYHYLVRSLIYLTHSRPSISFVVSMVFRFMQQPHQIHWKEAK